MTDNFQIFPVGFIRKKNDTVFIEIDKKYTDAFLGLEQFSHINVLYWFHENDNPQSRNTLQVNPCRNKKNPLTGVFATRSPVRPNLIALTLCKIKSIDKNIITIEKTDAFDDTPVLDLKPYIPGYDGDGKATLPKWVRGK